jgi:hypothetical protein
VLGLKAWETFAHAIIKTTRGAKVSRLVELRPAIP